LSTILRVGRIPRPNRSHFLFGMRFSLFPQRLSSTHSPANGAHSSCHWPLSSPFLYLPLVFHPPASASFCFLRITRRSNLNVFLFFHFLCCSSGSNLGPFFPLRNKILLRSGVRILTLEDEIIQGPFRDPNRFSRPSAPHFFPICCARPPGTFPTWA